MNELPMISVAMPTYNRAQHLSYFLENISKQTYPKEKLEVVIADGFSPDNTADVVAKYSFCKFIQHETTDAEERRKMAIEACAGEYIFLVDDDNFLPNPELLVNMMEALIGEKGANAVECLWHYYDPKDYPANRYCALIGSADPSTMYLKRQDHMPLFEKGWRSKGTIVKDTEKYYILRFEIGEVPTMGMNGFLAKKNDILACSMGNTVMHMETCAYLVENGRKDFIFMKDYFGHNCVKTQNQMVAKLRRNILRYNIDGSQRRMNYEMSPLKMIKLGLIMGTFIIPLFDAIRGFVAVHDWAWFMHPVVCFRVTCCYTWHTLRKIFLKK